MKTLVLLLALVACVCSEGTHYQGVAASTSRKSVDKSYSYPDPVARPSAPTYSEPAAPPRPASAYSAEQASQSPPASFDPQGYYYYYYPVQEQKEKGLFELKDSDLLLVVIVGMVVVGGLLVALTYFDTSEGRRLDPIRVSYDDIYDVAKTVYKAISKKY
ncbi:uncharacterized protein [Cherax quadricarinatus]|uniref:uncharacterized protein n=1 Tax=Cherax quadricarinatus TaxID=27406 RepID=UPI00387EB579